MSDFNFMRTGLMGTIGEPATNNVDVDFLQRVVSILKVLNERVLMTSVEFARACGRNKATSVDVKHALKFQAMTFFEDEWDDEFARHLQEEQRHTYETDEEDDETIDEDEGEEDEEDEEDDLSEEPPEDTIVVACESNASDDDVLLHARVMSCVDSWATWHPEDPVKAFLKSAVDRAEAVH